MQGLGIQLQSAREAKQLSITDAAEYIHVRESYLSALEKEAWTEFGDPIYARGFLRTYAHFLDLEAERFVHEFNSLAPTTTKLLGPNEAMPVSKRPLPVKTLGGGFAAGICTAVAAWVFIMPHAPVAGSSVPAPLVSSAPQARVSGAPAVQSAAPLSTAPTSAPAAAAPTAASTAHTAAPAEPTAAAAAPSALPHQSANGRKTSAHTDTRRSQTAIHLPSRVLSHHVIASRQSRRIERRSAYHTAIIRSYRSSWRSASRASARATHTKKSHIDSPVPLLV